MLITDSMAGSYYHYISIREYHRQYEVYNLIYKEDTMRKIHLTVALLTVTMAVLIVFGCGRSSQQGNSVVNEVSSGILSSVQEMPVSGERGKGSIRGVVHEKLLSDSSCTGGNAVYVFEGRNAVPDDIDRIAADPVDYVIVKFDSASGQYHYRITRLKASDYTLAFTCQAAEDNPDTDNYISFQSIRNVTVVAGKDTIEHLFKSGV